MNCPQCHLAVGADQYAFGEHEHVEVAEQEFARERWLWILCNHCGPCEVRLRQEPGERIERVLFKQAARRPADANRILSRLPMIDTTPPGTPRSRRTYQPAEAAL